MSEDKVIIGRFLSTFGLKGDLEISFNFEEDTDFYIKSLKHIYLQNKKTKRFEAFSITFKKEGEKILCHIKNVDSMERAKMFCNATVFASAKDLPKKEDTVFLFELFGKKVKLDNGQEIGKLTNVFRHANKDYLEIDFGKYTIPAQEPFLIKLDKDQIILSKDYILDLKSQKN